MSEFDGISPRIDSDPESVERGLVTSVLPRGGLLRPRLERQARRGGGEGGQSDEQIFALD